MIYPSLKDYEARVEAVSIIKEVGLLILNGEC